MNDAPERQRRRETEIVYRNFDQSYRTCNVCLGNIMSATCVGNVVICRMCLGHMTKVGL